MEELKKYKILVVGGRNIGKTHTFNEMLVIEKKNIIMGEFFSTNGFNEFWNNLSEEKQNELTENIKNQLRKGKLEI